MTLNLAIDEIQIHRLKLKGSPIRFTKYKFMIELFAIYEILPLKTRQSANLLIIDVARGMPLWWWISHLHIL